MTGARQQIEQERARLVVHTLQIVEGRYAERDLTLIRVARELAVSPRHLQRALTDAGQPGFRELLERARMTRAWTLLVEGDASSTDIAPQVGYGNPSAFAKAFRRYHGQAPYRMRQVYNPKPGTLH